MGLNNQMKHGLEFISRLRVTLRARNYRREMLLNHAKYNAFLLSFPKCGRTWHRVMLGHYLSSLTKSDWIGLFELEKLCDAVGISRIRYSHNCSSPTHRIPSSHELVGSPLEWADKDVTVLVRDPRDAMVSMYFHMKYREKRFDGTITQFLHSEIYGISKLTSAWKKWSENRHRAKSFLVQSYEQMHSDPVQILRDTLLMLGLIRFDEKKLNEAVEFASLGNLRELESKNSFNSDLLSNPSGEPFAAKVRDGKVGGYEETLSKQEIALIENAIHEIKDPFSTPAVRPR